jgi:hypothetical protein
MNQEQPNDIRTIEASDAPYDPDSEQRMSLKTERRVRGEAKLFNVVHIFGPIKDEAVFEYERRRNQSMGEATEQEIDQTGGTAIESSRGAAAALHYWNSTGTRAEGYSGQPSDADKIFAVNNVLFGLEFNEAPLASGEELCPEADEGPATYGARCIFNGQVVEVSASLRPATPDELSEFQRLMSRTILVRGQRFGKQDVIIPSKAKRLAEMFDRMKLSAEGYIGRIPAHHKFAFAARHLRSEQQLVTGN